MDSQDKAVGTRIKQLRKYLKLTQEAFGNRLGVSGSSISFYEKGERNLTSTMAKSICREYKVDYLWLIEGSGNMFIEAPEDLIDELMEEYNLDDLDKKIVTEYLKLDTDTRQAIKTYIQNLFL